MAATKKILLAVNDSDVSMKAVQYVADMCGSLLTCDICLLHVVPEPPPYYYIEGHSHADFVKEKEAVAQQIFKKARDLLSNAGRVPDKISQKIYFTEQAETISQAILKEQAAHSFTTVVLGKRGVSKAEEFLFGSISNSIAQRCNDFTVWIVA